MNKRNIRHSLIILVTTYITVAWPFSALSQAPVCDQIFLQNFSESQMESASHLETPKTASAPSYIHEFAAETLKSALLEGTKPYSLAYDVQKNSSSKWAFQRDIESLTFTFLQADSTTSRAEAFNKWVTSEEKALFLYDQLNKVGLSNFKEELDYLQQNNVYFIEGRKTGNGLLTYAFEKEGITTDITLFYRPPKIPEQTWLDMSEEDRFAILKKVPIQLKTFVGENVIAPTGLKPNFVGGYSQELSNSTLKGYGWEISHKKYEINRQRLMREIREIAGIFKSTHSFHVHIVFELPKKYERYKDFIYWYKQVNDYLYLKGLEEGLHGNYLTGVANIAADMSWGERIADWFRGFYSTHRIIAESQQALGKFISKFFSAGLRAGMYGQASTPENMKIGIELRDSTRNLELLDQFTDKLSQSIEKKSWETDDYDQIRENTLRLTTDHPTSRDAMKDIVSREYAKLFSEIEPTSHFGLIRYEEQKYYNYVTHSWIEVPEPVKERLRKARAVYEQDLRDLEKELRGYKAKNQKTEVELIQAALRMCLATWAKAARVSELFGGI